MTARTLVAFALLSTVVLSGCVTTTYSASEWGTPHQEQEWSRPGSIYSIRQVVRRQEGNPAGGAVAGAIIGGMIGGRGAAAVAGAVGGAMVGAAVSQGSAEQRWYEVAVRYDDGGFETYTYEYAPPFRPGDRVAMTPRGLTEW